MFFPSDPDTSQKPPQVPPRPPRSQKEATMAVPEPPDDAVNMLMEITGVGRSLAIRWLKVKQNDANGAVMAILDQQNIEDLEQASNWDESLFNADREGNQNLQSLAATAPTSRAPTPNSSRVSDHPTSKDDEDRMIQEATNNSMGQKPQQESGVIMRDGTEVNTTTSFGPAMQKEYGSDWQLVPVLRSSEVVPDVDIEQRKHSPGEPHFLKHLPGAEYLANFLTICHAIAGAREIMLMRDSVRSSYGQDTGWWMGNSIVLPRVVHTVSGTPVEPDADNYEEIITEVQRLMAVLDASDRSYVSPGALTQIGAIGDKDAANEQNRTILELFMEEWTLASLSMSNTQKDVSNFFRTTVTSSDISSSEGKEAFLISLKPHTPKDEKSYLIELLDDLFWSVDDEENDGDTYIEYPAEVLAIGLHQDNVAAEKLLTEIPAEFYIDRYLRTNMDLAKSVRRQIASGRARLRMIDAIEYKLKTVKVPERSEPLDATKMLEHAQGFFSGQNRANDDNADLANGDTSAEHDTRPAHHGEIAQKLNKIITSINQKLEALASEKEKTRKAIAELSRGPLPDLEGKEKHRYFLRGVATKPNITYVLRQKEDEDEDMDSESNDEDTTPEGMQWWRIEYTVNGSNAEAIKSQTKDYDVLRAVELEHDEALLVYASDKVNDIAQNHPELPQALKEFVERDNAQFAADLRDAIEGRDPPAYNLGDNDSACDVPRPSIEPTQRSSMDSTRVEGGGSDASGSLSPPRYDEDGFMDRPDFGLGPDIKDGHYATAEMGDAEPVHEIRLEGDESGTQMVEKEHEPLVPLNKVRRDRGGDTVMESQD